MNMNRRLVETFLVVGLALFAFHAGFFQISCVDVGFHVRTGELVLEQGGIPTQNTFSFAQPEQPWLLHQWAPGVVWYLVWRHGGVIGLIVFKALLGVAIILIVWLAARRASFAASGLSGWTWALWASTAAVMMARQRFFERPFMFSALLLALLVLLGRAWRGKRWWEWLGLPLFMALWANVHAGVAYGFLLLVAWCVGEWAEAAGTWWRARAADAKAGPSISVGRLIVRPVGILLAVAAALISVWLVNPNGPRLLLLPLIYFLNPFWKDLIMEFHPPAGGTTAWLYAWLGLTVLFQAWHWRRLRLGLLIPALVFGVLALRTQRAVLMFVVTATPLLAALLADTFGERRPELSRRISVLALPLVWLALTLGPVRHDPTYRYGVGVYSGYHPRPLFTFMREHVPRQRIYNDMRYGGGLLLWLYPDFRPFIDGRCEAYSLEFWRDVYVPVSLGEASWKPVFERYDIHGALVPLPVDPATLGLAPVLLAHPEWVLVAFDDRTMFFLERTEQNAAAIERLEFHLLQPGDWNLANVTPETAVQAVAEAERAVALAPNGIFSQTALAKATMLARQYDRACELWRTLTAGGRAGPNYWRDYGYCLFMARRYDEAGEVYAHMIKKDLAPAFAWYMRHSLALRVGDKRAAAQALDYALELAPAEPIYRAAKQALAAGAPAATDPADN